MNRNSTVSRDRPIIYIDYNYNSWKVLFFIATEDAGITKAGITYLSQYPNPFVNVSINRVSRTLYMSKSLRYVNEFDSHNNSIPYALALEKYWVSQHGFLQLCTPVSTGITITDLLENILLFGIKT